MDNAGNRYYSRENIFPIRNSNNPYVKILGIGEVFDPGRLPTVQIIEVDSGGKHIDHQIFDPGAGYKRLVPESHHHGIVSRFGNGAKATSTIAEGGIISEIKVFPEGSGYEAGDLVSATPPSIFEKGQEISLEARLIGPQGQIERLAFYANGVEIQNPVTEMIGGYYRTTFTALNPGDYFLSARALYGDQRDSSGSKSSFMGYSNSNVSF